MPLSDYFARQTMSTRPFCLRPYLHFPTNSRRAACDPRSSKATSPQPLHFPFQRQNCPCDTPSPLPFAGSVARTHAHTIHLDWPIPAAITWGGFRERFLYLPASRFPVPPLAPLSLFENMWVVKWWLGDSGFVSETHGQPFSLQLTLLTRGSEMLVVDKPWLCMGPIRCLTLPPLPGSRDNNDHQLDKFLVFCRGYFAREWPCSTRQCRGRLCGGTIEQKQAQIEIATKQTCLERLRMDSLFEPELSPCALFNPGTPYVMSRSLG